MPCYLVPLDEEMGAIVCSRGRKAPIPPCSVCGRPAGLLCDYPVGKRKTCDQRLCACCAVEVGPDKHYCPSHEQMPLPIDRA